MQLELTKSLCVSSFIEKSKKEYDSFPQLASMCALLCGQPTFS